MLTRAAAGELLWSNLTWTLRRGPEPTARSIAGTVSRRAGSTVPCWPSSRGHASSRPQRPIATEVRCIGRLLPCSEDDGDACPCNRLSPITPGEKDVRHGGGTSARCRTWSRAPGSGRDDLPTGYPAKPGGGGRYLSLISGSPPVRVGCRA